MSNNNSKQSNSNSRYNTAGIILLSIFLMLSVRCTIYINFFKSLSVHTNWYVIPILEELTEKAIAPNSSTLAWKIPWMEEPGRLQSMGSLGVGHDWVTSLSLFTFMHWRRKWQPTPVFLPGEPQGWGSLVVCLLWVAQSRTRLKRLSSSSRGPQD